MNTAKPKHVCNICNKTFTRKADLTRHARLHAGIKPYICEVEGCRKRFAQYTALKTHVNVHTRSKPYACGVRGCMSTFGDPSSCSRHRREMHGSRRRYECSFPDCKSSILRLSAFKAHLRRHGEQYVETFMREETLAKVGGSTGLNGNEEEQATLESFSGSQVNTLPRLPDDWESFLSLPEDTCRIIDTPFIRELTFGPDTTAISMGLQAGHFPGPSCSTTPLVLSPCPRFAPDSDNGYFLSPPRAPPLTSSQYSSPLLPTPALTPTIGLEFTSGVGALMSPCLAPQNWTQIPWQEDGSARFLG